MPEPKNLMQGQWSKNRTYTTGSDEEPLQCYLEGLVNSNNFDLLLGYFSSSAINVLSLGFANFLYSNGTMRMIINNVLSQEDKDAIIKGKEGSIKNNLIDITDIKKLKSILDDYGKHFFECLAWLIANDKIQVKIIKPKNDKGIAHYKSGIFSDGINKVRFKASCNFTSYGLLENLEELDIHLSWENNPLNQNIINEHQERFNNIFSENADFVEYLEVNDILIAIKDEFGNKSLHELIVQEEELIAQKNQIIDNKHLKKLFAKLTEKFEKITKEPRFPYPSGPREYQIEAYKKWVENNKNGIFSMATGTGKTITALYCLLKEYQADNRYNAIIIVPTLSLLSQWHEEGKKFNFRNFVLVSLNKKWERELQSYINTASLPNASFIIIVTYATFKKAKFQDYIKKLPASSLLIADEAHNLGSIDTLKILPKIKIKKRIGLSATPNRKYDEFGNKEIENFFNDNNPYVYSFPMKEAIQKGFLCRYTYHPRLVQLNEEEFDKYIEITKRIVWCYNQSEVNINNSTDLETLLLIRKKIIHKANNKKEAFKNILEKEFERKGNLNYTLVYAPEGIDNNFSEVESEFEGSEDIILLDEYSRIVRDIDNNIMVSQFIANTQNRDKLLKDFEKGEIHVLVSMKCLDEGIDVPRSEVAIFCASTGNPRQFIQRRGRVLRPHIDKTYARIYDLVVIPPVGDNGMYAMERSLIKNELERVIEFADLSMNKMEAYEILKKIITDYNLTFTTENNDVT